MKTKNVFFIAVLSTFLFMAQGCNNSANDNLPKDCGEKIGPEEGSICGISEFRLETTAYPNPVANGGTSNVRAVVGAIDQQFNPIPITITIRIFNVGGSLVNTSVFTPQPVLTPQVIPLWQNISAASGVYYAELIIDKGACGSEKVCVNGIQVIS